jgi:cysteinyl-tRNA synthetase
VYDFTHIGHIRAYIFVDILRRSLLYNGFDLTHIMNITDVGHLTDDQDQGEDKLEQKAALEKQTVWDIAVQYTRDFFETMDAVKVERPDIICKATEHISEMIALIQKIEANGYSYRISDGIYFDTARIVDYGKLALLDLDSLKEGARVEPNQEKRNPTDFALWKFSAIGEQRQMEWDSPWGLGFPGWHIECTAMSVKYLGTTIDIHTGGIDHIPVHHTNEIAQAQGAYGTDIVHFWLHNEFMLVDGAKMSKSKGNFYRLADIEARGISPLALRYFFRRICQAQHD